MPEDTYQLDGEILCSHSYILLVPYWFLIRFMTVWARSPSRPCTMQPGLSLTQLCHCNFFFSITIAIQPFIPKLPSPLGPTDTIVLLAYSHHSWAQPPVCSHWQNYSYLQGSHRLGPVILTKQINSPLSRQRFEPRSSCPDNDALIHSAMPHRLPFSLLSCLFYST